MLSKEGAIERISEKTGAFSDLEQLKHFAKSYKSSRTFLTLAESRLAELNDEQGRADISRKLRLKLDGSGKIIVDNEEEASLLIRYLCYKIIEENRTNKILGSKQCKGNTMKAVIYARYSSDNQREESIEGQIRECTEYAKYNELEIVGQYIDRAFSAKTDDRPDFQRMIQDSAKKLFDVVLVWKLDRFARNRYDSAFYRYTLRKNGVRVVSAKENISDGPEGIILESLLEGMAEFYSANLSQNVKRGFQGEMPSRASGNGGAVPLGYKVVDHKLESMRLPPPSCRRCSR